MFDIKKIRVTKIEEFAKASEAVKSAEEAVAGIGFEIRAVTEKGDLQLTIDDLKKIAEEEAKGEATPEQPAFAGSVECQSSALLEPMNSKPKKRN